MSSLGSPSLAIEPARDAQRVIGAAAVGLLGVVPWWVSGLHPAVAAALSGFGLIAGALECRRIGWTLGHRELQQVVWSESGAWFLRTAAGGSVPAVLMVARQWANRWALLKLTGSFGTRWALITGDTALHRRLAVRLRLEGFSDRNPVQPAQ